VARNIASKRYRKEGDFFITDEPVFTERGKEDRYPFGFAPTLHRERYRNLDIHKVGSPIFISALGDMFEYWMPDKYIQEIFRECQARPKHTYLFMTKTPERYKELKLPGDKNFWYGTSVSCNADMDNLEYLPADRNTFVCFEPLREKLFIPEECLKNAKWAIIGAQMGRFKDKAIPKKGWVQDIADLCRDIDIPVFMRPSLLSVMGEDGMRREKPDSMVYSKYSDRYREAVYQVPCIRCGEKHDKKFLVRIGASLGRKGPLRKLCNICRPCYEEWCKEWGMDSYTGIIFDEGGKQNEEELQEDS
jgi:hypothetical protein